MAFPYPKYEPRPDDEFVITAYGDNQWAIVRKDDQDTTDADLDADPSKRELYLDKGVALQRLRDLNQGDGEADRGFASQVSQQDQAVQEEAKEQETAAPKPVARQPTAQRAPAPAAPPPPPRKA